MKGGRRLTGDQIHGNKNGTERRQLRQNVVNLVVGIRHLDGNLREVVRVRPGENLLVVIKILRHSYQVVLKRSVVGLCSSVR